MIRMQSTSHKSIKTRLFSGIMALVIALSTAAAIVPTQDAYAASNTRRSSSNYSYNYYPSSATSKDSYILSTIPVDHRWTAARNHIGEYGTIAGKVYGVSYRPDVKGQPTFINIGADYPSSNRMQVVIWGSDRGNWYYTPESLYRGQWIAVTGSIQLYRGVPEIIVSSPSQIDLLQ